MAGVCSFLTGFTLKLSGSFRECSQISVVNMVLETQLLFLQWLFNFRYLLQLGSWKNNLLCLPSLISCFTCSFGYYMPSVKAHIKMTQSTIILWNSHKRFFCLTFCTLEERIVIHDKLSDEQVKWDFINMYLSNRNANGTIKGVLVLIRQ